MEDEWKSVIPQLAQIQVDTTSPSTSTSTTNSLIQENYISSDGGLGANMDLLSLSHEDMAGGRQNHHRQQPPPPQQQQRPPRHYQMTHENPDVTI